jgi:hypothetical protein
MARQQDSSEIKLRKTKENTQEFEEFGGQEIVKQISWWGRKTFKYIR